MIDTMRSLLNSGMDTLLAAQAQQTNRAELTQAPVKKAAPKIETPKPSPAYEINLSPQARMLLQALEERRLNGEDTNSNQSSVNESKEKEKRSGIQRPSVSVALEHLLNQHGMPEFSPENQEKLDQLFRSLEQEISSFRNQNNNGLGNGGEGPTNEEGSAGAPLRVAPDAGYRSSLDNLQPLENQVAPEVGAPIKGADGLTMMERMKSAILYSELDRILGGAGVYFGGDQMISQMDGEVGQRMTEAKTNLTGILANGQMQEQLTPAQEARLDAIFREIAAIQDQSRDRNTGARKAAILNLIERNAGARVVDAGNASLGG